MKALFVILVSFVLFAGCDTAEPKKKGQRPTKLNNAAAKNPETTSAVSDSKAAGGETEDVPLKPGSNVPHHGGERATDIVAVPLHAMNWAKGKILIANIENHLKQYKGANDRFPKDTDEFMTEIVKKNNLELPKLAADESFFFDSDKGELMVRRPKK